VSRIPQLYSVPPKQLPLHIASYDYFARVNIGFHFAFGPTVTLPRSFPAYFQNAVNEQIFLPVTSPLFLFLADARCCTRGGPMCSPWSQDSLHLNFQPVLLPQKLWERQKLPAASRLLSSTRDTST